MRLRWFRRLRRRLCGASHNTVDSITGENTGRWVRSCGFWGETAAGLPGELMVTEAKQDMRADRASVSR